MYKLSLATIPLSAMLFAQPCVAEDTIKIGVLATLKGAYTVLGEDAVRGVKVALDEVGAEIAGKKIKLVVKSISTSPESAVKAAEELLQSDVDLIIGPLSSDQGIAIKDFSKTKIQATFINGISGAVETTFVNPSNNFFRFNTDNAQWSAGLGQYVFNEKDFKKVAVIAEDYSFNHAQVFGFENEFCSAGGEVTQRHWLPLGENEYSKTIQDISEDVDAVYLGLSGSAAIRFVEEFQQTGRQTSFIGSSITVDGALLNAPDALKPNLIGMASSGPQADTWGDDAWQAYVTRYKDLFSPEQRFVAPSIIATGYHNAALASLSCIASVKADLSDGHEKFRQCLGALELNAPNGPIKLDANRQAIANNYVTEITKQEDGSLVKKLVKIEKNVGQTLGLATKDFAALGMPSRDNKVCKK